MKKDIFKGKEKLLLIIGALLIVFVAIGVSYAYFTAAITGSSSDNVVTTGTMIVEFDDGTPNVTGEKLYPGQSITKSFSVKNIGNVPALYDIYINDVINTFIDKNDLVFELTSTNNGATIEETVMPSSNIKIASNVGIEVGTTQEYTFTITFKETNDNQDDNKSKSFSAQVSLVEKDENITDNSLIPGSVGAKMIELVSNGATDLEYDGATNFGENGTSDNNLRYVGSSPNNYVYYNCSTTNPNEMNDETCEKWRIIGLMNNIEDANNNFASRVKIMRDESLGYYTWDTTDISVNKGFGINQWGESTYEDGTTYEGADLMRELNTDYLGNITIGTDGRWYIGEKNTKERQGIPLGVMPTNLLNQNAQRMIQEVNWNTGANNSIVETSWTPKSMYTDERSNNTGKICTGDTYCLDEVKRTTTWLGKVALMYPSDFGYSTSGGSTINKETCLNSPFTSWWDDNKECSENSWIFNNVYWQWTLTPCANISYNTIVFYVRNTGSLGGTSLDTDSAYNGRTVRPVVYLKSNVLVNGGDGSSSQPYKLTI